MNARMNSQARDIVRGMIEADSIPEVCDICGAKLDGNRYSPFATICRECADEATDAENS